MIEFENLKQPYMGKCCKELRENAGLSVSEFAKRSNVTRQAVYKFERGKSASLKLFLKYHSLGGDEK